jgi:O-antigen/teichoic acid export membrane protein
MGQVVNVAAGPCGQLLNMSGNERMTTWAVAIGLLVNATFGVALVPALGAAGAAISGAIATLTWNVVMVMAVKRSLGINSSIIGNASLKLIGNGVRARARKNKARDDVTPL